MASISFIVSLSRRACNTIQPACQARCKGNPARARVLGRAGRCAAATARGFLATVLRRGIVAAAILGTCGAGLSGSRAVGAEGSSPSGTAGVAPAGDALTPDAAMRAFGVVEAWVRAGRTGAADVPGVHGAAVTIRVDGRVVGRGSALAESAGEVPAILAAADAAIAEAAAAMPRGNDALVQATVEGEFWSRARLSVEFAGPLVPLAVATYDDADAEVRPGIEGVAARAGSRVETVFPEAMLSRGIGPGDALAYAITRAVGEPGVALREDAAGQPGALGESRGVRAYRFRTVHIAHAAEGVEFGGAGGGPVFLDRCGRVVRDWPRGAQDIREWAGAMARHIEGRRRVVDGGAVYGGVYRPVTGAFDEPGSALEEILGARALAAYAGIAGAEGERARAVAAACEMVDALAARGDGGRAPWNDAASAAVWCCLVPQCAAARGLDPADDAPWPEPWRRSYSRSLAVLGRSAADLGGIAPEHRAVVAFALARRSVEPWPGANDAPAARAALDAVAAATGPGLLAARMPWLGWGELCMEGEAIAGAPALREFRESVYAHQLRAEAMDADHEDLAGGIVFTAARSPLPTWQGARVASFLAPAMRDPRLTDPDERLKEAARLTATLRFLRQLTADGACGFMYAEPARAAGGVRAALWDQRQPLEATALALITACETLRGSGVPERP